MTDPTDRNLNSDLLSKGIMISLWEKYLSLQRRALVDLEIGSFQISGLLKYSHEQHYSK